MGGWRDGRIQRQYANLPLANAFDRIYSSGARGDKDARNSIPAEGPPDIMFLSTASSSIRF